MRLLRRSRPRSAMIMALLLSTLVLAGILALQAIAASRYHRATAERVLSDYALAAAEETAQRISQDFEYYGFYPVFRILARLDMGPPAVPLPDSAALWNGAGDYEQRALRGLRRLFRVDLVSPSLVASEGSSTEDPTLRWLLDTIPTHALEIYQEDWRSAVLIRADSEPSVFVYSLHRGNDDTPLTGYGFELRSASVLALLRTAVEREPLLPPSLLRGIDADSLIFVQLVSSSGRSIYASHSDKPGTAGFFATVPADPRLGGLTAHVALRPEAARRLIIGGLPGARLPFILGLLLLSAALILIALLQLRREQELARLRTEFVSNVSHELRTPLAQIRMFAETLLLGRIRSEDERERSLEIIDKEARRLTHLVENVLQFSRVERRVATLAFEWTRLAPLIWGILDVFEPATDARDIRFRSELDERIEANVDRGALQQMVLNLLDNAVKYGPDPQTITVGLELDGEWVRLRVDDEGYGIPEVDRSRIWERFTRLEHEHGSSPAGTGIGLSVVRDLARLHGGRTWAEEAPGGGARFVIELPNARMGVGVPPSEPGGTESSRHPEVRAGIENGP